MPDQTFEQMGMAKRDFISLSESMTDIDLENGLGCIQLPYTCDLRGKGQSKQKSVAGLAKENINGRDLPCCESWS